MEITAHTFGKYDFIKQSQIIALFHPSSGFLK